MAKSKSKRAKPSFDRTPPTNADAWVHRSDAPASVIDVAPVLAISVPTRAMSRLERTIELMSRPFGVVVLIGVATIGAFRRRRTLLILVLFGALTSISCRSRPIWSGAEFLPNGRLKLSAEEPYCGCLTIANAMSQDLKLISRFHGTMIGQTTLKAGQKLPLRYDWTGPSNDDVYEIEAADAAGKEIPGSMKAAIRIEDKSLWVECTTAQCPYGDLMLNLGDSGR